MKIKIYVTSGVFYTTAEVEGKRVLRTYFPDHTFVLHESHDGEDYVVSEMTLGASVARGETSDEALVNAERTLSRLTEAQFLEGLQKAKDARTKNRAMLKDPLWCALYAAGYTLTETQLQGFKIALVEEGYELKKIDNDSPRN